VKFAIHFLTSYIALPEGPGYEQTVRIRMLTLLKIITFPIWFPIKVLWAISKFLAFVFLLLFLAAVIYVAVHIL